MASSIKPTNAEEKRRGVKKPLHHRESIDSYLKAYGIISELMEGIDPNNIKKEENLVEALRRQLYDRYTNYLKKKSTKISALGPLYEKYTDPWRENLTDSSEELTNFFEKEVYGAVEKYIKRNTGKEDIIEYLRDFSESPYSAIIRCIGYFKPKLNQITKDIEKTPDARIFERGTRGGIKIISYMNGLMRRNLVECEVWKPKVKLYFLTKDGRDVYELIEQLDSFFKSVEKPPLKGYYYEPNFKGCGYS